MALPFSPRISPIYTLTAGQVGPFTPSPAWPLYAAADLKVLRQRAGAVAELVLDADYAVTGAGPDSEGFSMLLLAGALEGDKLLIAGDRAVARITTYTAERGTTPTFLNLDLNMVFAQLQEMQREVERSFKTDPFNPDAFDIQGRRLSNVGAGTEAGDAVNLGQIQSSLDTATATATATAVAAAGAAGSAQSGAEAAQGATEAAAAVAGDAASAAAAAAGAAISAAAMFPVIAPGDAGRALVVKGTEDGFEVGDPVGGSIYYNAVTDGGVDSTGATSVATSLAAAITAAASAGKPLYIPSGTYDCAAAKFVIPDGMMVLASPYASLRRTADPGSAGPLFDLGNDVQWRGGILKSTLVASVVDVNNSAMRLQGKSGVKVEKMHMEGLFYVGLIFETAINCHAHLCSARGIKNRAFYVYQQCNDVSFVDCRANGYNVGGTTRTTDYGFNVNPANVSTTRNCTNIRIIGNKAEHCAAQGIEFGDRTYSSVISGNTVEDSGSIGILLQKANGELALQNTIVGNTVRSCVSHGIYLVEPYYNTVNGNTSYGNGGDGIRSAGGQYTTIAGNVCNGNTGNGIGIGSNGSNHSVRCVVTGNVAAVNTLNGVKLDTSSVNNLVVANIIQGNTAGQLSDSATGTISANNVTT